MGQCLGLEVSNFLFLHCEVALELWNKLLSLLGISWVCLDSLDIFFLSRYGFFGHNKGKKKLQEVAKLVLWCVWFETWLSES